MKKLVFYSCILALISLISSCTKTEINTTSGSLTKRTTFAERYNYNGITYVLYFDTDDTTGTPTNSSTEDSLNNAIGATDVYLAYFDTDPTVTYLLPESTSPTDSLENYDPIAPNECLYAEYFEDVNFSGSSFCVDAYFTDHKGAILNGNLETEFMGEPYLSTRVINHTTNWDDRISSFRMYGSGASKDWYRDHNYASSTAKAIFILYRNNNYSTGSCNYKTWTMSLPYAATNTWEVPNLKKEKWRGVLCANMNDRTSSLKVIFCKNSYCFQP